jgi:hypothetical protein
MTEGDPATCEVREDETAEKLLLRTPVWRARRQKRDGRGKARS